MFLSQPEESCPRVYLLYIPVHGYTYYIFLGVRQKTIVSSLGYLISYYIPYVFWIYIHFLYEFWIYIHFLYICSGQYNISSEERCFILSPAPYTLFHWRLPVSVGHRRFQSLLFRKLTTSTVSVPTSQDIDDICLSAKKQRCRQKRIRASSRRLTISAELQKGAGRRG